MHVPDDRDPTTRNRATRIALDLFGATDTGRIRKVNEDQFVVASLHKSVQVLQTSIDNPEVFEPLEEVVAHLLVVADGVGGHRGGSLASGTAVTAIVEHLGETMGCLPGSDVEREHGLLTELQAAAERAHVEVRRRQPDGDSRPPATTLTMVVLVWPRAYVVHIGDSRAYVLSGGRLRQLTRDQNAYEALVDRGVIPESPTGQRHHLQDVLVSAVGTEIEPSIGLIDLDPGDAVLLCTDGLTKHVVDDEIENVLRACASAEHACRRLMELTLERGASDNVTVVVGRTAIR